MTTNTNPSRKPAARFFAADKPAFGTYPVIDREDNAIVVNIKGRAAARALAGQLNQLNPAPREADDVQPAKAEGKRTSHADCAHAATKLARAICRRERAKADTEA